MDPVTIILIAAALAVVASKRKGTPFPPSGWLWPMPAVVVDDVTYVPVISSGFGTPRAGTTGHRGVDVDYRRRTVLDLVRKYPPGTAGGTPMHFCPTGVPIMAARDGLLWSSGFTERGGSVVIDHGKPFATYYTHMATLAFPPHRGGKMVATGKPTLVKKGDVIGTVGGDPYPNASKFRHLHFAVWDGGTDASAVDPESEMKLWPRVAWKFTAKG